MIILAIDTSERATAALTDGEEVLAAWQAPVSGKHAELTGPALAELTAGQPAPEHVIVGIGPGPFTGLRAGIATGIGYALGAGIPVAGVPSHLALAVRAYRQGATGRLLAATDARRKEVYWTLFTAPDAAGVPQTAAGPEVCAPSALPGTLRAWLSEQEPGDGGGIANLIGGGFALYPEQLDPAQHAHPLTAGAQLIATDAPEAGDLGIAAARLLDSGAQLWETTPLYLRAPDAVPAAQAHTSLR